MACRRWADEQGAVHEETLTHELAWEPDRCAPGLVQVSLSVTEPRQARRVDRNVTLGGRLRPGLECVNSELNSSAIALSQESPREPTEATTAASTKRSV
ncbi:hypothetical protein GCM10017567_12540 [Amycolatopsis bullii]|uniref:Uncharacterized protein n=1 Tax=Amycolatopsis bullii TaxID=941987 RepID=A0ABQ3K7V4_9PSEU|nr:hypothetical protein GCM10017567_12540 [Amycolatopsis bullii]